MTRPTRIALLLLFGALPLAAAPAVLGASLWTYWFVATVACLIGIAIDAALALPSRRLRIELATPEVLYSGAEELGTISIEAQVAGAPAIEARVDVGPTLAAIPHLSLRFDEDRRATGTISLRPSRRGEATIDSVWLRWRGPLGLVERIRRIRYDRTIPVIPDIRSVRQEALRFFTHRQFLVGQKVQRYLGEGSEFESLKEYQPGYDPRGLDWKATARHRTLLVREFQAERNHPVVLAIDSGHLMREPIAGTPKIDLAINAALLLAYVALKSGDRVGMVGFDDGIRVAAAPRRGVGSFPRLQERCARLEYSDRETNFTLSVAQISQQVRRRSLVVFFTDFVDSITAELMLDNLRRIGKRHLLLFVRLRDPGLEEIRDRTPTDAGVVHRAQVADQLLRERAEVFAKLRRSGVQCLDLVPDDVSAGLVQKYLRIRNREMVG